MKDFQEKLAALFKRYECDHEDYMERLAEDLGCSLATLYNWRSGKNEPSRMAKSNIESLFKRPARSDAA